MADIVGSLFGASPQAVQAEMTAPIFNRAAQFAQLTPMQQAQYGIYSGGAMMGQGIGGLLGGEDPRLVQARQMQQVKDWIAQSGVDINSPEGLAQAAQYAQSIGATEGAMVLGQQARTISRASAEEQYKLAQAQAALKEKLPTAAKELIAAGYTPDSPEFQAKMRQIIEADITGKAKGSGSSTSVTIDAGSLAKAMGVDVGKQAAGIEGKYSALDSLAEAKKKLKSGIYAGAYGPEQMAAAKYTLGAAGSAKKVQNTEEFMSYIGNTVVPRLQEFGGNDSVEELKYLQRIMGGDQRLEPKSLENILNSAEKKINRGIERLQSQTQAAGKKAPPPLGPGVSREAEQKTPRKVFNPATGKIEVQ